MSQAPTRRPRNLRKSPMCHEPAHITWAREARGLTRAQVAAAIGKQPSIVTEIEKGTRNATPDTLRAIANFLGCPVTMLERRVRAEESAA